VGSRLHTGVNQKSGKYRKDVLTEIVAASLSIADVCRKLNIAPLGGNYATVKRYIQHHHISTSHFTGQLWSKGKQLPAKRPLREYLVAGRPVNSSMLRQRLIKEKIFDHKCYGCRLSEWRGRPIPLELEHKNGDHDDNRLENLTLLCPNCHAQTKTYRGRNIERFKIAS
jgi:hypothetical protein